MNVCPIHEEFLVFYWKKKINILAEEEIFVLVYVQNLSGRGGKNQKKKKKTLVACKENWVVDASGWEETFHPISFL